MTTTEARAWLLAAGEALGEEERYWFGSLRDVAGDLAREAERGRAALLTLAHMRARPFGKGGPLLRRLCLFARAVARGLT